MAKSVLDIVIKLTKQGGADKETVKGLVSLKTAYLQAAAVAGVFGGALKYVIEEAAKAERVDAQLVAVLKSTNHAAGMAKEEVDALAKSLQRQSTYSQDAVKSSSALLLTFTSIGKDVFPEAQQAVLDMSTAMGTDLKSASIQVGKALNNPLVGLTALQRVGVSFTEDQKALIKTLVDSGRTMEAQKIILAELNKEFGGSAAAAAKTYSGQIEQLKNEFGDLAEGLEMKLLPSLTDLISGLNILTQMQNDVNVLMDSGENTYRRAALAQTAVTRAQETYNKELVGSTDGIAAQSAALDANTLAAEENAEALKELSDANKSLLNLIGKMQSAQESYGEKYAQISSDMSLSDDERKAKLAELAAQHDLDTKKIVLGLLEQRLAQGGFTTEELDFLLEKGRAWGIYSDTVIAEAREAMSQIDRMASSINAIPTSKTVTIRVQQLGGYNYGSSGYYNIAYAGRAAGGPIMPGREYLVGEDGPETFVSDRRGTIIPNDRGGQGQQVNINLTFAPMLSTASRADVEKLMPLIEDGARRALKNLGK